MDDDGEPESGHRLEEGAESGLVQVAPVNGPTDLQALEPDLGGPLRLGDGEGHVLQRDSRPQCDEAIGMLGHGGGDPVVLHPAQLRPDLAGGPVAVLGHEGGQALDVHPHPVHVLQPSLGHGECVGDGGEHLLVVLPRGLAHEVVVRLHLGAEEGGSSLTHTGRG